LKLGLVTRFLDDNSQERGGTPIIGFSDSMFIQLLHGVTLLAVNCFGWYRDVMCCRRLSLWRRCSERVHTAFTMDIFPGKAVVIVDPRLTLRILMIVACSIYRQQDLRTVGHDVI